MVLINEKKILSLAKPEEPRLRRSKLVWQTTKGGNVEKMRDGAMDKWGMGVLFYSTSAIHRRVNIFVAAVCVSRA